MRSRESWFHVMRHVSRRCSVLTHDVSTSIWPGTYASTIPQEINTFPRKRSSQSLARTPEGKYGGLCVCDHTHADINYDTIILDKLSGFSRHTKMLCTLSLMLKRLKWLDTYREPEAHVLYGYEEGGRHMYVCFLPQK
jgi:hypothetical protein